MSRLSLHLLTAFCSTAWLIVFLDPSVAQTKPEGSQLMAAFAAGEPLDDEARRTLARTWLEEVSAIDEALPPETATDAAYLKVEFDDELAGNQGKPTKRSRAARSTMAFKRREANRIVTENVRILTLLRSPDLGLEREILAWARLARNWLDRSYNAALVEIALDHVALRARLYTSPDQSPEGLIQARQRRGRFVILSFVVPHLAAQVPDR